MRIFILDDDPHRHDVFHKVLKDHTVVSAFDHDMAINLLRSEERFDLMFLDHDLCDFNDRSKLSMGYGNFELTGADVAVFIAQSLRPEKRPDRVIVHSWNPEGAKDIHAILVANGINAEIAPFRDPGEDYE